MGNPSIRGICGNPFPSCTRLCRQSWSVPASISLCNLYESLGTRNVGLEKTKNMVIRANFLSFWEGGVAKRTTGLFGFVRSPIKAERSRSKPTAEASQPRWSWIWSRLTTTFIEPKPDILTFCCSIRKYFSLFLYHSTIACNAHIDKR